MLEHRMREGFLECVLRIQNNFVTSGVISTIHDIHTKTHAIASLVLYTIAHTHTHIDIRIHLFCKIILHNYIEHMASKAPIHHAELYSQYNV